MSCSCASTTEKPSFERVIWSSTWCSMKGSNKATVLTLAEKCKNILVSNWQGYLNTIKTDAQGSKENIYTSKVKYIIRKGNPLIWVPEHELHNVNTIIDERGSFSVASPYPGPLGKLLKSMNKFPVRVALTGDVVPVKDKKAESAANYLKEMMLSEEKALKEFSYTVSSVLSSSNHFSTTRSENLKELIDGGEKYVIYKFNLSSCMFVDGNGGTHEVDFEDMEKCKASLLAPYSAKLIDGINQSEARRRGLILFCFTYLNVNARDAYMLSLDRKGFDVLGKVRSKVTGDEIDEYQWKQFRITFKEETRDIESFCQQLVEMEEDAIKKVSSYSGLG
ncbi:uncharacterized protein LOC105778243 isoform X7 [Gossypium raimondii]|uniref:DUF2470 domain-containing protein n=2 Tax=Gossypium raimondii TaxID=29730 RepID=A0A0D2RT04_GOSRA|nr:uncharacterized protein LOC105778243 isoform X1 [Gossypium raimondii]XP_052477520.1 uncharacterized protein LOC105778243 isoform X2 [Gossypium raimondii]XP_052477521.1 uncharacterized protein LOC105778243 isoform X3 [Gossypium raimondii]XP_052477522.1 uncharacterized protein LOC105778243 isoform X4 [Gossypium raimondii]XP_052477523.1 uncharacterized protein LOC105778243 isoform X5 [Gossypium raimondii]XP_052477524.1 uncharacterized protein LOC105778243 isoform X6 [Gossypium raimondii]XP_05